MFVLAGKAVDPSAREPPFFASKFPPKILTKSVVFHSFVKYDLYVSSEASQLYLYNSFACHLN